MKKETMTPSDVAFHRLYFVNLLTGTGAKCKDFHEARYMYPSTAAIAEKLTGTELKHLTDQIESILYTLTGRFS